MSSASLKLALMPLSQKKLKTGQPAAGSIALLYLNSPQMKKIEAIISPKNLEAVQEGLKAAGIVGRVMVTAVSRLQRSSAPFTPNPPLDRDLVCSLKVELIVSDYLTCKAINAIFDYTCSQEKDFAVGQITVLPVETIFQIGGEEP